MRKYLHKVWFILGNSKSRVLLLLLFLILSSVLETVGIGLLGPFFSVVSNPASIQEVPALRFIYDWLHLKNNSQFIVALSLFVVIVFCVKSVLYFFSKYYILSFAHNHRAQLIVDLNQAYLYSPYHFYLKSSSANVAKNILIETQNFCYQALLPILYAVSNGLILLFLFILLAITNLSLLVWTLAVLLPVFILFYGLKNKLRKWGQSASDALESILKTSNHGLGGFKETRVIGCEPYFEAQMVVHTKTYARTASLTNSIQMLPRVVIETVLLVFIVTFIGISTLLSPQSSNQIIATLSVFAVAAIRLLPAASQLVEVMGSVQQSRHAVDILYADLQEIEQQYTFKLQKFVEGGRAQNSSPKTESRSTATFTDRVNVSNIIYQYPDTPKPAINGISLSFKKGESIAFIGKSGAGKTSLVDIILGLLVPQSGDITVDGVSIYNNLREWQNLLGYIPQSIFLLDDTVERNIAFGVPEHLIDPARVEQAIQAAQLGELVAQLPQGIHTRVGERGIRLSGGQRQRIGIARALYHEREILVLDEATSALDTETEKKVSQSIQSLAGQKTLIIIAHRLSTVKDCDRIYLLEKGQVVKTGKFENVVGIKPPLHEKA